MLMKASYFPMQYLSSLVYKGVTRFRQRISNKNYLLLTNEGIKIDKMRW